jgi:hypothetical protein
MELFTGKILFPTSKTYEHLLMMEKVTSSHFPYSMVEQIKNKEVKPLFDLGKEKEGSSVSLIIQTPDLLETIDTHHLKRMQTIEVGTAHTANSRGAR